MTEDEKAALEKFILISQTGATNEPGYFYQNVENQIISYLTDNPHLLEDMNSLIFGETSDYFSDMGKRGHLQINKRLDKVHDEINCLLSDYEKDGLISANDVLLFQSTISSLVFDTPHEEYDNKSTNLAASVNFLQMVGLSRKTLETKKTHNSNVFSKLSEKANELFNLTSEVYFVSGGLFKQESNLSEFSPKALKIILPKLMRMAEERSEIHEKIMGQKTKELDLESIAVDFNINGHSYVTAASEAVATQANSPLRQN